jgi:hypothetical protein
MRKAKDADARRPGTDNQAAGIAQTANRQQSIPQQFIPTTKYSTLTAAAAFACAAAAHLHEELSARRANGCLPTRELCLLLPIAEYMGEQLSYLAAQEGGAP